jgi:hypothetical protein
MASLDGLEVQLQCFLAAFVNDHNDYNNRSGIKIGRDNLRNEGLKAIEEPRRPNNQK